MLTKEMLTTKRPPTGELPAHCNGATPATTYVELLTMSMPAEPRFVTFARSAIQSIAEQLRMNQDCVGDLMLAVGEACNNGVLYGANRHGQVVTITCRVSRAASRKDDFLEIDVRNHGCGFAGGVDCSDFKMPAPELLADHGRGLPLMQSVVDRVEICSDGGDTVVRLVKHL